MMYLQNIVLLVSIYGRRALAALPDSCQDDGPDVCGSKKCVLPLGSEDEPSGTGEVWYSHCCTVSETSSTSTSAGDPPITESKKYCYNYVLNGYPSNELNGIKPVCSENASSNSAWTLDGQCRASGGHNDPFDTLPATSDGCPGAYDPNNTYEIGDTVEDNGVVYTCSAAAAAFCNVNAPNLRGVGVSYWKPTNSCTGTSNPTSSPVFANIQEGCPDEFDSTATYEANDSVSVKRKDGFSLIYMCKPFPASQWCNVDTYSPLSTEELCNGDVCWPLAWNSAGACDGTFTPTATPTYDPADIQGCPDEYNVGNESEYEEGDKVSVTPLGEAYGKIYQCKSWPHSGNCKKEAYSPSNTEKLCNGDVCWPEAWTYVGGCEGTIAPTGTPTYDPADIQGCPEEFHEASEYEAGDKVSVTLLGEAYGKIYQCKSWPHSEHCGDETYSPSNTWKGCNGEVCWPEAWTYIGGCEGTIAPTGTPTYDPADIQGCPKDYEDGTEYEAGDKVSVTSQGEAYGKIYQCKSWPYSKYCGDETYSPSNTWEGCNGEVCWPEAWTYIGGCEGTIAPTNAPMFRSLPEWDKGGCPPAYVPNSAYEGNDYVSVAKTEDNTYGVVWQCKDAMTAPWCRNEGYAPGTPNGDEAWEKVGYCEGTMSPTVSPTMLASNPNPSKRLCQFKYKLDTTSDGEYIVLQAGSWKKGGTMFATVSGGKPFDLYKTGHVVRYGSDARKCNGWPYTPYCDQFSPFSRDASDYNPELSPKGWKKIACEDIVSEGDVSGDEDEFNPDNNGPVFDSNGRLLVDSSGHCINDAINPEDYFKPDGKGCRIFAPSSEPSLAPSMSSEPSSLPSLAPSESSEPSGLPSLLPSKHPSSEPSGLPSLTPSESSQPSGLPSLAPSESSEPSGLPSLAPSESSQPSGLPSLAPSESSQPSGLPSLAPSESSQPSGLPSLAPSKSSQPSGLPSLAPSESTEPSGFPSMAPSESSEPSGLPSLAPSKSSQPSSEPSGLPSLLPSKHPSSEPSGLPSLAPSKSSQPSGLPSLAPSESYQPSSLPSLTPSGFPSLLPSKSLLPFKCSAPSESLTKVGVYMQPNLNGAAAAGTCAAETYNLVSIVRTFIKTDGSFSSFAVDESISYFSDPNLAAKLASMSFFFMVDIEGTLQGWNSASQGILKEYVQNGGTLMMTGTSGTRDTDFLNAAFGWDLTSEYCSDTYKNAGNTAGTPWEDEDVALGCPSATQTVNCRSVECTPMWGNKSRAAVVVFPHGEGRVIYLGFDYYNTGYSVDGYHINCSQRFNPWVTSALRGSLLYARCVSSAPED